MKNKIIKSTIVLSSIFMFSFSSFAADTYKLDQDHTSIVFKISHQDTSNVYGRFNDVSGKVILDEKNIAKSYVEVSVKADSIDTRVEQRDNHLKSPDFLNVKQFPLIIFKSTKVEKHGKKNFKVNGNMTIHGVTKPVSFIFNKTGESVNENGKKIMGGETTFTIKRSDFGMNFMQGPGGVGNEITLILAFEGAAIK